jgi:triosephosphate isomerase
MRALVIANWKMHPGSFRQARALFEASKKAADAAPEVELLIAPPSLYLHELASSYRGKRLQFAAQNGYPDDGKSHTGEISLEQLRDAGASAVLIGHAERREMGESNADVRAKMAAALKAKMRPVMCVGERVRDSSGEHFAFVAEELRAALADVSSSALSKLAIAYEPVWAIGSDTAMSPALMHEMAIFIRKTVVELHGEAGHRVRILYGGAIDAENASAMLEHGDVTGLLVGRASTDGASLRSLLTTIRHL